MTLVILIFHYTLSEVPVGYFFTRAFLLLFLFSDFLAISLVSSVKSVFIDFFP